MALTAAEQYLIELINRARLDPRAEADRYGLSLNAGLTTGTISSAAKQVLAPNLNLETASYDHSAWMLEEDIFSHTGVSGSNPGNRMATAGYEFTGSWTWRENLAWVGSTGPISMAEAIEDHHEGLYRSAGHRVNTFAADIREIGIAQVAGDFSQSGVTYNASMLTETFAASGTDVFLTGVAFADSNGDDFYTIGEGHSGVWVSVDGARADTASAGGYGLGLSAGSDIVVTVGQGGSTLASLRVDLSSGNGKLDLITDNDGSQTLALSVSATLLSGVSDAMLLGVADLDLTGTGANNTLTGNAGANRLTGGDGNDQLAGLDGADMLYGGRGADVLTGGDGDDILDGGVGRDDAWGDRGGLGDGGAVSDNADRLLGGAGNDWLTGYAGNDYLDGAVGDDTLTGGGGRDTFAFAAGRDLVTDFTDNVDTLQLDIVGVTVNDVIALGEVADGDAVFDFGGGNVLTLQGVTDLSILGNDLEII